MIYMTGLLANNSDWDINTTQVCIYLVFIHPLLSANNDNVGTYLLNELVP